MGAARPARESLRDVPGVIIGFEDGHSPRLGFSKEGTLWRAAPFRRRRTELIFLARLAPRGGARGLSPRLRDARDKIRLRGIFGSDDAGTIPQVSESGSSSMGGALFLRR